VKNQELQDWRLDAEAQNLLFPVDMSLASLPLRSFAECPGQMLVKLGAAGHADS